jgi:hypothetical protein
MVMQTHPLEKPDAPEGTSDSVELFQDDEAGYLGWLAQHPRGWLVDSRRSPARAGVRLHRASCWTMSGTPAKGTTWKAGSWTGGTQSKTCSSSVAALRSWASATLQQDLTTCGHCASYAARASRLHASADGRAIRALSSAVGGDMT